MSDLLNELADAYAGQQEAILRARYRLVALTLENQFYTDPDPDGQTVWLRDRTGATEDQPFGDQDTASEARGALILHKLIAHDARIRANSTSP